MLNQALIQRRLNAELSCIVDAAVVDVMKRLLVVPRCELQERD